jgi:hypothetical protein
VENNVNKSDAASPKCLNSKDICSQAQNLSTPGKANAGIVRSLMPGGQDVPAAVHTGWSRRQPAQMFFTNFVDKIVRKGLDLDQGC